MGDDMNAPNPGQVHVSPALNAAALGRQLAEQYLPSVAGCNHSWLLQLNTVAFARVSFPSEDTPHVEALVDKMEFLAEGNTVWCKYEVKHAPAQEEAAAS